MSDKVHFAITVAYGGTVISKTLAVSGDATDSVKVVRGMETLSRQINGMVQIAQGVKEQDS